MISAFDNYTQKKELVGLLKELQDFHLRAAENLEQKAWNILSVTSATFGVVSAILVTLITDTTPGIFWAILIFVLFLYLLQVRQVLHAIRPILWDIVPGAEPNNYDGFQLKFLVFYNETTRQAEQLTDDQYYDQLMADYIGNVDKAGTAHLGSIQKIEENNKSKAAHIRSAIRLLGFIITGLIVLSFIAASGR